MMETTDKMKVATKAKYKQLKYALRERGKILN
jgi:hypothetical protein